ncbi:MAG TPA: DUF885 domain-containing protein [Ideonella sp.]|uniref:DUF885 domain-containing protein n=1 Tax=Ideonella sp. TaxID=1929293 RepID=UPI002E2F4E69|nr:DUF885 domain-containing protein [Ideonella sp.]HEX5687883.1 DUF885 domain-containing protein [Ideonella sp.]
MRKTIFRTLAGLIAAALLLVAIFVVNLVWFRPFSLNHFYEKVFVAFMLDNPELLTMMGVAEQFGYRRHNAHLNDESDAKAQRDFAQWRQNLADLKAYDLDRQTEEQRLSTRVLTWFIESQLEGERFRLHNYPVNQLFGVQSQTPDFLINQHRIADRRGADDYLARLGEIGRKFDQVQEGLVLREQKGIVPPRFVIERVLAEMRGFAGKPSAENPLCVNFKTKVEALTDVGAADKPGLEARCPELVDQVVRPAYQKLITFFEGQLTRATTDDGVWKLPDGDAYYAYRVRRETTSTMTPQQVHELGGSEVARIESEMKAILTAQGQLQGDETAAQALSRLAKDPKFLYPNTEEGRKAALATYSQMITELLQRSRAVIGLSPKAPIEVQRVPEFKEKTAPGAYYQPPAMDGSRPGVFYANLRDMGALPTFGMRTLAIHEGVPGHHFQIALSHEQQGGPTFRKVLPFTAYMEGWALYAEWLGTELGVYKDDPFGDLGRLQAEMFRAVRLVVDTGLHAQRWTRQQAIDYMVAKTGMPEGEVVAEIERYIVDPGQACAYKVGMLSIRAARDRAQMALGAQWNAEAEKAFHDVVLRGGALPLAVLDEQVDAWIKSRL